MQKNPTLIICDNSVWYRISDGRIPEKDIICKRLVGTFINGYEFCSSQNGYKKFDQLRGAVAAMGLHAQGFCIEAPIEYMKLVSGHESDSSKWKEISYLLWTLHQTEQPDSNPELTRTTYEEYEDLVYSENQPFLQLIDEYRSQIKNKGFYKNSMKKPEVRLEHKEVTKEVLSTLAGGLALNWDALELFLCTLDEWLRQLTIQHNLTMTINDWNDVLNLSYVGPGCLYWTEDYIKTREFIISGGCAHYLYQSGKIYG